MDDASLVFVSDRSGYWNLHVYDASGVRTAIADEAEYGLPMWSLGSTNYVVTGRHQVVAQRIRGRRSHAGHAADIERGVYDTAADRVREPREPHADSERHRVHRRQRRRSRPDYGTRPRHRKHDDARPCRRTGLPRWDPFVTAGRSDSRPRTVRAAYANFYPPRHPECTGTPGELPPRSSSRPTAGPTSAAGRTLSLRVQYYTSRGWGVLDVNYGGSTGFGRAYRERLNGRWAWSMWRIALPGAKHLASAGKVDIDRIAIRGGSAGGYTTLAAVTFADVFRARCQPLRHRRPGGARA